jgi:histidinol-phosphatase (PHP family)
MQLPADGHAHSQWSWDARMGSMEESCAAAVELGLPAVAFTDHLDLTPFRAGYLVENFGPLVTDGTLTAPEFDVAGYFDCIEHCRSKYPGLRLLAGLEVGQPHHHGRELASLVGSRPFDRILGSLHCLEDDGRFAEPFELFAHRPAATVFRDYLAEIPRMVDGSELFEVFAHIDYPVRSWPDDAQPFDPRDYEDELRFALRAIAAGGRALEVSAKLPLSPLILDWWVEAGGRRVTFGSDGHEPWTLGRGLAGVAAMAESRGFRPDTRLEDPWVLRARTG